MLMPIGMTIILQAVGPQNMGRVMGIFGVPMLIAPAVGPVLGGWFVQDFSWRLIFYVNVPIGVVGFIAASRFLRESHRTAGLRLDVLGLITGVPAILALMYAVDRSTALGWSLATGAVAARRQRAADGLFIVRQLRAREPLLQLSLFSDRNVLLGHGAQLRGGDGHVRHHAAAAAVPAGGARLRRHRDRPAAAAAGRDGCHVDAPGRLPHRPHRPEWVVATGMVLLTIGSIVLAQIHYNSSNWLVIGALMLRGFAMGFAMMPTMSAAMARVPRRYTSRASSITNTFQRVSSSVGIAVLVTVLAAQFSTAAGQTTCAPTPAVVAAASSSCTVPASTARSTARCCSSGCPRRQRRRAPGARSQPPATPCWTPSTTPTPGMSSATRSTAPSC